MRPPRYIISRVNSLIISVIFYRRYILYHIRFSSSSSSRSVFFGHLFHRVDSRPLANLLMCDKVTISFLRQNLA